MYRAAAFLLAAYVATILSVAIHQADANNATDPVPTSPSNGTAPGNATQTSVTSNNTTLAPTTTANATSASVSAATTNGSATTGPASAATTSGTTTATSNPPNVTSAIVTQSTTPSSTVTSVKPVSSIKPAGGATTTSLTKAADTRSGFDAGSFVGGIVLAVGLTVIGVVGYKCYQRRRGAKSYQTL